MSRTAEQKKVRSQMVLPICSKKVPTEIVLSEESSYILVDVKNHIRLHQISFLNYVGPLLDNAPKGIWVVL
jgi:hypothetical protein